MNTPALLASLALFDEGCQRLIQRMPILQYLTPRYIWMNAKKANNAKGAKTSLVEAFRRMPMACAVGALERKVGSIG